MHDAYHDPVARYINDIAEACRQQDSGRLQAEIFCPDVRSPSEQRRYREMLLLLQ